LVDFEGIELYTRRSDMSMNLQMTPQHLFRQDLNCVYCKRDLPNHEIGCPQGIAEEQHNMNKGEKNAREKEA
jgi:hypothetical protein